MTYIYGLFCPVAQTFRYVGKADDPERRLQSHIRTCEKNAHHTGRWLAGLKRQGMQPLAIVLAEVGAGEDWREAERRFIASGQEMGWKLTNSTPGGEGGGWLRAEDKAAWVEKVRASLSTAEVRDRISNGVRMAYERTEMRAKASARFKRAWQDPAAREKMLLAMRSGMRTDEGRANFASAAREKMARAGAKENVSAKLREYYSTAEGREKKAEVSKRPERVKASRDGQIRNWSDPEYRNRIMSAKTSPEVLTKQKEKARQQWANPAVRERMLAAMKESRDKRKAQKSCK